MKKAGFLVWALAVCPAAVWLVLVKSWSDDDDPVTWWTLLLTVPAIATGLVGALARQSHRMIVLAMLGSAAITGGIMLAVIAYLISIDAFD